MFLLPCNNCKYGPSQLQLDFMVVKLEENRLKFIGSFGLKHWLHDRDGWFIGIDDGLLASENNSFRTDEDKTFDKINLTLYVQD